jgi:hypothetical protein
MLDPKLAIADVLTTLIAPDGLVPSPETVDQFVAHLRGLGFAVTLQTGEGEALC